MTTKRVPAVTLGATGLFFAGAAIVRIRADETGPDAAEALASAAWLASHSLAMAAFVLLVPAVIALHGLAQGQARVIVVLTWLGTALILPYYGAETFALAAAGEYALATGDMAVVAAIEAFRWAPLPMAAFGTGLILLGVAGAILLRSTWHGPLLVRLGGVLTGIGLLTYLPQFFLPLSVRTGHGVLLGAGLVLLAGCLIRYGTPHASSTVVRQEATPSSAW